MCFETLNTVFHSGCQQKLISVALFRAPLYVSTAPAYLMFSYFWDLSLCRNALLCSLDFIELMINCVLKCNIAIFFCCRILGPNNFIAGYSTMSSSKCQPVNVTVSATVFIKYSLWHYRKEMWNIPNTLTSLILAWQYQHKGTSSLPWHCEPSCVILWP